MTIRPMTQQERNRFLDCNPAPRGWRGWLFLMAIFIPPSGFIGFACALLVAIGLRIFGLPRIEANALALPFGCAAAICVYAYGLHHQWRMDRRNARARPVVTADLAQGEVAEEVCGILNISRLAVADEPEAGELLLIETEDGRIRAVFDEYTEGKRPRLARSMHVLRLPQSGIEISTFSGATIRRPPPQMSDPRLWPEDDNCWITQRRFRELLDDTAGR